MFTEAKVAAENYIQENFLQPDYVMKPWPNAGEFIAWIKENQPSSFL